jgi:hypothetical protein
MNRWFKFSATYWHRGTGPSTQVEYFYLKDSPNDEMFEEECLEWARNTQEGRIYLDLVDHARIDYEFERLNALPLDVKHKKIAEYEKGIENYQKLIQAASEVISDE